MKPVTDGRALSPADVQQIFARIRAKLGVDLVPKQMPAAKVRTVRQVERLKARKLLAQAIVDQVRTCDELEKQEPSA